MRYRRALWTAATSAVAHGLTLVLVILAVWLALPYLGPSRFGVWALFATLGLALSFLDLGVGNAMVNRIAAVSSDSTVDELQRTVTGGAGLLLLLGFASGILLSVLSVTLPWHVLLRTRDEGLAAEASHAALIFSGTFSVNLFAIGLQRVLAGLQRGYEANIVQICATAAACIGMTVSAWLQLDLVWLTLATTGVQTVVTLAVYPLIRKRGLLRWRSVATDVRREAPRLMPVAKLYFALQLGAVVVTAADPLVLTGLLGPEQVAVYVVVQRLFQVVSQPFALVSTSLWPAYADAYYRKDQEFIARTLKTSLRIGLTGGSLAACVMALVAQQLIPIWTQDLLRVSGLLLLAFAVWTVLEVMGTSFAMYLNGCGIVRPQILVVAILCLVAVPLKSLLALSGGIEGFLAGTIISYLFAVVIPYSTIFRRQLTAPLRRAGETGLAGAARPPEIGVGVGPSLKR